MQNGEGGSIDDAMQFTCALTSDAVPKLHAAVGRLAANLPVEKITYA